MRTKKQLSHLTRSRQPRMVDVSAKRPTVRTAVARGVVAVPAAVMNRLRAGELHGPKGPVFQTAIIAGTMAAKRTGDLIPLCHPLPVEGCQITIRARGRQIVIEASVRTTHQTGVEMEALTAVSVAALTVYDMCKALSHDIVIRDIRLLRKTGGKSDYVDPT
ncbi:cyclic pyranopterin monophosphate synthase MoaC [bacterium]|nr:cyclic pyranopterin monophosphate synthase MoaC [bacterium]